MGIAMYSCNSPLNAYILFPHDMPTSVTLICDIIPCSSYNHYSRTDPSSSKINCISRSNSYPARICLSTVKRHDPTSKAVTNIVSAAAAPDPMSYASTNLWHPSILLCGERNLQLHQNNLPWADGVNTSVSSYNNYDNHPFHSAHRAPV